MSRPVFIWRFALLPILPSRTAHLGGTVATIGFPDPSLQGFSPKLAGFNAKAQSGKDARQIPSVLCALASLRLCVNFLVGGAGTSGALPEILADGHQLNYAVKSR